MFMEIMANLFWLW